MKKVRTKRTVRIWSIIVFLVVFLSTNGGVDLERLEDASYHYQIWKEDPASGERIFVTQCNKPVLTDAVEVECQAANTTWYMDIALTNGWFSRTQTVLVTLVCFCRLNLTGVLSGGNTSL